MGQPHLYEHSFDIELGLKMPYERIYNLSEVELQTVKTYIVMNLSNSFIHQSAS